MPSQKIALCTFTCYAVAELSSKDGSSLVVEDFVCGGDVCGSNTKLDFDWFY